MRSLDERGQARKSVSHIPTGRARRASHCARSASAHGQSSPGQLRWPQDQEPFPEADDLETRVAKRMSAQELKPAGRRRIMLLSSTETARRFYFSNGLREGRQSAGLARPRVIP